MGGGISLASCWDAGLGSYYGSGIDAEGRHESKELCQASGLPTTSVTGAAASTGPTVVEKSADEPEASQAHREVAA